MSLLQFTEVLVSQLLNNCSDNLDIKDNDPDQLPFIASENKSASEDYDVNGFDKYCHLRNKNRPHQCIKNPKGIGKVVKIPQKLTIALYVTTIMFVIKQYLSAEVVIFLCVSKLQSILCRHQEIIAVCFTSKFFVHLNVL